MHRSAIRQEIQFARLANGTPLAWARHGQGPTLVRVGHWLTHMRNDPGSPLWQPWLDRLGREATLVRARPAGPGGARPGQQQIAAHLALSDKTMRNAVSRLYRRRGVEGRAQAVVRARDLGY